MHPIGCGGIGCGISNNGGGIGGGCGADGTLRQNIKGGGGHGGPQKALGGG